MSHKTKAVRVSQENLLKLSEWMKAHKTVLESIPHTYKRISEMATADLSFPIADNTIARTARYLSINIKGIGQGGGKATKLKGRKIEILREHLALLYHKLGEDTPEEIGVNWPAV